MKKYFEIPENYRKHRERVKKNTGIRIEEQKRLLAVFKKDGCKVCGELDFSCLDAHHIDPKQKEFTIGFGRSFGIKRVVAELEKCVCLCSNCHRKLHAGKITLAE